MLGVSAGDICYFNGLVWTIVSGNTSSTKWLQETSAGVPSWSVPAGGCLTGPYLSVPYYYTNPTGTVCAPSDEIFAGIDPAGPASTIDMLGIGTVSPGATLQVIGQTPAPQGGGNGRLATEVLFVQGGSGGDTTDTSGSQGGDGSSAYIYAGDGGNAPGTSTNGIGGSVTIGGGRPGAGAGAGNDYGPVFLQPDEDEPGFIYRGPVIVGLGFCAGLHSTDDYPVDFCINKIQPYPSVAGDGTPAHDALEVIGDTGGATTGTTGQTGGKGGGIHLAGGHGGDAPSGSTNGDGGDIVLAPGVPGVGAGSAGAAGRTIVLTDFAFNGCTAEPTCSSGLRGTTHYVCSGAGVADILEVCTKNAADTYTWETITVTP